MENVEGVNPKGIFSKLTANAYFNFVAKQKRCLEFELSTKRSKAPCSETLFESVTESPNTVAKTSKTVGILNRSKPYKYVI